MLISRDQLLQRETKRRDVSAGWFRFKEKPEHISQS